ncbi:hypothetical protein DFH28DRAFT_925269 [Melampsora americana]|nr:hypothetical protein DFH28DRAFT_925269 [Melampsora americana]
MKELRVGRVLPVPLNLANNSYNISRDSVIENYIVRFNGTGRTLPTLNSFIPFPHNAERSNANHVSPTNTPQLSVSSPSESQISSNASTQIPEPELDPTISNLIDPNLH